MRVAADIIILSNMEVIIDRSQLSKGSEIDETSVQ